MARGCLGCQAAWAQRKGEGRLSGSSCAHKWRPKQLPPLTPARWGRDVSGMD